MKLSSIIFTGLILLGVWFLFLRPDYSKPWWNGNEVQKVCATTGSGNCYNLVVSSDGENVNEISLPNGGYIEAQSSECAKASQLNDARLCRMWDSENVKWDIMKI